MSKKPWAVFEYSTGIIWHVAHSTKKRAKREAKLGNKGLLVEDMVAYPLKKTRELANAWSHGRSAGWTEANE